MKGTEAEACAATMQACVPKVTRLVVVDDDGTPIEFLNLSKIVFSLQEDCRTLVILTDKNAPVREQKASKQGVKGKMIPNGNKRSDIAKDLGTKKYRQRVVPDKRKKPGGQTLEEILRENDDRD